LVGHANDLTQALEAMDYEGDDVPDAKALLSAIEWVIAQPDSVVCSLSARSKI
jgi:hypothetical protein